jgi:DNA-binding response OmpR family regulator
MKGAILVVEDEQAIADLVRAYLRRDGFQVVWARSGEQALEELSRHPVRLVVLDIGLPGIDGFEVCRRLRSRTGVPILILSARDDEVDRVAGLEAGADDYVTKPFSPRELVARVPPRSTAALWRSATSPSTAPPASSPSPASRSS